MASRVETSILGRFANESDPLCSITLNALAELDRRDEKLYITPQNLVEFHNIATRPIAVNGLGYPFTVAEEMAELFEDLFTLLPENDAIYPAWKALVKAGGIIGKQVHDARLVAICQVYGINQVVTFNTQHFARLASFVPNLTVIDPCTFSRKEAEEQCQRKLMLMILSLSPNKAK